MRGKNFNNSFKTMHPEPHADEIALMRWLDGQMTAAEIAQFEQKLANSEALRREAESFKAISMGIQAHVPKAELRNADFFNHQIQEAIAAERKQVKAPVGREPSAVWEMLRRLWPMTAAAAAVVLLVNVWSDSKRVSEVVSSYAPNSDIQVASHYNAEAKATVLVLEGLEAIPADQPLVGYSISHSETDTELAITRLYDESGKMVALLTQNAMNQPSVMTR
jgi:anti-sigma factor RsiW